MQVKKKPALMAGFFVGDVNVFRGVVNVFFEKRRFGSVFVERLTDSRCCRRE
jgi:hypothetical protein